MGPAIEYLFDPRLVEERLDRLPRLKSLVGDPAREGVSANAFPRLRKTRREIFRVIGRSDAYPHLAQLLQELESCLARGWTSHQLKASSHDEFGSLVSELHAARHFLGRGFTLNTTTGETIAGRKPEFYVSDGEIDAGVEVFQPRDWRLLDEFTSKASAFLFNADLGRDYLATLALGLEHEFDEHHRLIHPHPELYEDGLRDAGEQLFAELEAKLPKLTAPEDSLTVAPANINLKLDATFEYVGESGDEPVREIRHGYSVSAYSPEWIFGEIAEKVRAKARRRQAGAPDVNYTRLLIVDLSTSPIRPHLDDTIRRPRYLEVIQDTLGETVRCDYDIIALCESTLDDGLQPRFVVATAKAAEAAERLVGPLEMHVLIAVR